MKQKTSEQKFPHPYLVIAAVVAIAVGAGVYIYSKKTEPIVDSSVTTHNGYSPSANSNTNSGSTIPAGSPELLKGKNILNIGPQSSGKSLIVDLVNSVKPGFIAVYQANGKGQAGQLIASSELIKAGTSEDLVVKAALKANTTYIISLRADNGDSKFDPAKDAIVNDIQGKPVVINITTGK